MIYRIPNLKLLFELHNKAREQSWLWKKKPLLLDNSLSAYASKWAEYMADVNTLLHSPASRILSMDFSMAGENIASGFKTEYDVMTYWMNSLSHKNNIMNSKYTHIGCGFSYSNQDILYWCVCFGKK
jgi:uncharacterized protein YkwD